MEQTFMSVRRSHLQKAFALAHRCADNPRCGDVERKYFRAIAFEIWQSCGESGEIPTTLPAAGELIGDLAAGEAA